MGALSAGINGPRTLPAEILYEGQGRNRVVYSVPGGVLKAKGLLCSKLVSEDEDHGREMEAYLRLPLLCAKVFWQGRGRGSSGPMTLGQRHHKR